MIDSIQKKVHAVNAIIATLQLKNVVTICSRAEELSRQKEFKHSFDYIIARAVGPIKDIVLWSKPLLKPSRETIATLHNNASERPLIPSGAILLLKGGELADEIEEARRKLNPRYLHSFPIMVDGIDSSELADKKLVIVYP